MTTTEEPVGIDSIPRNGKHPAEPGNFNSSDDIFRNEANNSTQLIFSGLPIERIIFEKANFGAIPLFYKLKGDDRWHTIDWTRNPHLQGIRFSDGTVTRVDQETPTVSREEAETEQPFLVKRLPSDEDPWSFLNKAIQERDDRSGVNQPFQPNDGSPGGELLSAIETPDVDLDEDAISAAMEQAGLDRKVDE